MELIFLLIIISENKAKIVNLDYFLISVSEFDQLEIIGDEYAVEDCCGLLTVDCGGGIHDNKIECWEGISIIGKEKLQSLKFPSLYEVAYLLFKCICMLSILIL